MSRVNVSAIEGEIGIIRLKVNPMQAMNSPINLDIVFIALLNP
ncbi:hypothetical protein AM10699_41800 [Acaryochloris marina MBIC10699]|nr:hypothetical protein AM10699_41800 [Acaryochloris marina MBIC10699]